MKGLIIKLSARFRGFVKNVVADWEMSSLVAFGIVLVIAGIVIMDRSFLIGGGSILIGKALSHL